MTRAIFNKEACQRPTTNSWNWSQWSRWGMCNLWAAQWIGPIKPFYPVHGHLETEAFPVPHWGEVVVKGCFPMLWWGKAIVVWFFSWAATWKRRVGVRWERKMSHSAFLPLTEPASFWCMICKRLLAAGIGLWSRTGFRPRCGTETTLVSLID